MKEATVGREGSISGTGLHTGERCTVTLKPAPARSGLRFFRDGRPLMAQVAEGARCTAVTDGRTEIRTVEHLLAALSGMGVSNAEIHADGPELPAVDGSALPYVAFVKELGVAAQERERESWRVTEPVFLGGDRRAVCAYPAEEFSVSYVLDYGFAPLRGVADFRVTPAVFEKELAPARTFCTAAEAEALKARGFGLGATPENTLVFSETGAQAPLRFPDEAARHKAMDLVGDLAFLGFALKARVVSVRGGHALNRKLVETLRRLKDDGTA